MSGLARVGVVLVLLGTGVAAGQAATPSVPEVPAPQDLPVVGRTAVCPDVLHDGDRGATAVTAAAAGTRTAGPVAGPLGPLEPGAVVRDLAAAVRGPFVVAAGGEQAGALTVEQATRATVGGRRGVLALTCPSPSVSSWFVGGSTTVGSKGELMLLNVEEQPALVDVQVWSADGPADPRPGRGLTVPGRGRLVVPLDRLAPDRDRLALHVQTTRGRVASALRVVRADGRTPWGVEWIPQSASPSTEVVVPGLPRGPGRRTALITNPGKEEARVSLELTTLDGQLVPEGRDAVVVLPGTTAAVDLTDQLATTPAALRVRSSGPAVLAGAVIVDDQRRPIRDISFSAGTPALDSVGYLADVRLTPATEVTLLLSALRDDAVVDVVPIAAPRALPEPQRVEVPAGTTVAVRLSRFLPPRSSGSLGFELRPVSGLVHAARYSRERGSRGPLTTLLPVQPARLSVRPPTVVADPGVGRY